MMGEAVLIGDVLPVTMADIRRRMNACENRLWVNEDSDSGNRVMEEKEQDERIYANG